MGYEQAGLSALLFSNQVATATARRPMRSSRLLPEGHAGHPDDAPGMGSLA
jgi:hypothetical protein